jgi:hypothetical protein
VPSLGYRYDRRSAGQREQPKLIRSMKSKTSALTLSAATAVLALGSLSPAMAVDRSDLVHDARRLEAAADALVETFIDDLEDRYDLSNRSPEIRLLDELEHVAADARKLVQKSSRGAVGSLDRDVVHLRQVMARVRQLSRQADVDRRTRSMMSNVLRAYDRMEETFDRVVDTRSRDRGHSHDDDRRYEVAERGRQRH